MTIPQPVLDKCLERSEYIEEVMKVCDEHEVHYGRGIVYFHDLDPDDPRYYPLYLMFDILVDEAEMGPDDALTLIDNSIRGVVTGLIEQAKEEED